MIFQVRAVRRRVSRGLSAHYEKQPQCTTWVRIDLQKDVQTGFTYASLKCKTAML